MAVYFKTSLTNNSSVNSSTSWTDYSVFNTNPSINNGGFNVSSSGISVPQSGVYLCCFNCYFITPSASRENVGVRWTINGTLQNEISASDYMRASPHEEASTDMQVAYSLSSNDSLGLRFAQLADTNQTTLQGSESSVTIIKLV